MLRRDDDGVDTFDGNTFKIPKIPTLYMIIIIL